LTSGQLVEILPTLTAPSMSVALLFPHRRNLSKRVRIFMDWLTSVVQSQI